VQELATARDLARNAASGGRFGAVDFVRQAIDLGEVVG
jgi:hypothetical protein